MGYRGRGRRRRRVAAVAPRRPTPQSRRGSPTADGAKGADVFKKCAACHTINQGGANGVGPNLYATVGEAIAQGKGGFDFSGALKGVGGSLGLREASNAWLKSPRKFADGTKMTFAGLSNAQDRANVILYLNQPGLQPARCRRPPHRAPRRTRMPRVIRHRRCRSTRRAANSAIEAVAQGPSAARNRRYRQYRHAPPAARRRWIPNADEARVARSGSRIPDDGDHDSARRWGIRCG